MPDGITIVLDPGHGGDNLGLNYNGHIEKEMNLIVANAMREELEKYDHVTVYLTNEDARGMSLKQRAAYGKEVGADVLISLHFNMSEGHTNFGSEVWVPSKGLAYRQMRSLGDIFLEEFEGIGLHTRGVKTRLNDRGTDYYGIIRESAELDIPAMIVEHCYADYKTDTPYIETKEDLQRFGQLDARAVAKYYGLTSEALGVDYSSYVKNGYYIPEGPIGSDATGPVDARIYLISSMEQNEGVPESQEIQQGITASFLLSAREEDSKLAYYSYSIDGGETYTELLPWQGSDSSAIINIEGIKQGDRLVAKIYNGHTVGSETNLLKFGEPVLETETGDEETGEEIGEPEEALQVSSQEPEENTIIRTLFGADEASVSNYKRNMSISLVLLLIIGFMLGITLYVRGKKERIKKALAIYLGAVLLFLGGFHGIHLYVVHQSQTGIETIAETETIAEIEEEEQEPVLLESFLKEEERMSKEEADVLLEQKKQTEIVYDIAEGYLRVETLESVPRNQYDFNFLTEENGYKAYKDDKGISAIRGIDASKFQGSIDWQAVKESGMEFAMLRIGIRGYESGEMVLDERFYENLQNAQAAGLRTGVYFFSTAITEEEAVEEAEFVLRALEGYQINMPIVFDTEPIYYAKARTDDLTPMELTDITIAFCERIKQSGYTPMIYANAKRLTTVLHLEKLVDYELWYADYQEKPLYPYQYKMWQYTEKGTVPGVSGNVDINLYFQADG
ncbi:MAG: N-acetylmuramoyl-L-alanine amidase [Roseburia sp.]|nr:N-acetylmuramoyl-L-alanine amidase [Roseburia sp.]MCM1280194.1 N-acetylmuramoyl-L-alanine amidase [Robinsoniella sp.]